MLLQNYIQDAAECLRVKKEDLDWKLYHILAVDPSRDEEELAAVAGASPDEIRSSLDRLIGANLLERTDGYFRVLSIEEMLLRCQAKYDKNCPFVIDNGIIKLKPLPGTRDE
jgi:hypothetical protein